ncbi:unnamed protein product [Citrullus colocynthis]|uniref:Uncharacterized protein n=1 Tax=Citrullus colocynthis TaxID=252529 RepID=A0ABP0Y518_9ROSI
MLVSTPRVGSCTEKMTMPTKQLQNGAFYSFHSRKSRRLFINCTPSRGLHAVAEWAECNSAQSCFNHPSVSSSFTDNCMGRISG